MKPPTRAAAIFTVMAVVISAHAEVRLNGGGATFPAEIYQRWIAEYQKLRPGVKVDYQPTGSGAGIKGITEKKLDFGCTDAPMSHKEMERAGGEESLIEIPSVAGAVVLTYNIPGFKGDLRLDGSTLADIFLGRVKRWDNLKITALNPAANLPDLPIAVVYRGDSSGTNFIFTHYLCGQSEEFDNKIGASKLVTWPVGMSAKGNDGIMQIVKATRGALGYVDLPVALKNNISFAMLRNKDGRFVKATIESITSACEAASAAMQGDVITTNIWDQGGENVYPIASFTYLVVYKDLSYLKDPAKAAALSDFLHWATSDGEAFASELHYAPLGPGARKAAQEALDHLTWAGKPASSASAATSRTP